jgi:Zn-dependent protease
MACLVFDVKPKIYRAAKRHGLYSYSEMTESHIGLIAAVGVIASLVFAVIGYLMGFSEFSRLSIYFAFFNMIPISDLDGNKIFFGSLILWSFLAALVLIGLGYVFFLV